MVDRRTQFHAYYQACYRIELEGHWAERRIGVEDAAADAALVAAGCRRRWAILTPCNPESITLSEADNRARLRSLRSVVETRDWRSLASLNLAEDSSWPEPGRCILDVDDRTLRALARRFGQRAFVSACLGFAPRLRWLIA